MAPELYVQIKDNNALKSDLVHYTKLAQTDLGYLDSLSVLEVNAKAAIKAFPRDLQL